MSKALVLAAGLSVAMTPAFAGEIIFGVGVDDALSRTNSSAGAFTFEYHLDPAWEGRNWTAGWGTVAQFDTPHNLLQSDGLFTTLVAATGAASLSAADADADEVHAVGG